MTIIEILLSNILGMLVLIWIYIRWIYIKIQYPNDPFNNPVNLYGETLTDAIQNSIVRGQRGISTYD